jgi:hypothetical protein
MPMNETEKPINERYGIGISALAVMVVVIIFFLSALKNRVEKIESSRMELNAAINALWAVRRASSEMDGKIYERGLDDGISGISLVNLERQMLQTNWSYLEMSNIVKTRMTTRPIAK